MLIHDAARPFVPAAVVAAVLDALDAAPGAFAALPVVDALWRAEDGRAEAPVPREGLWRAQTPQGFHFDRILAAHRACRGDAADDVAVARAAGIEVRIVPGSEANYKITTTADLGPGPGRRRADGPGRGAPDRGRRHRRLMDAILVVNAGSSSLKFQVFGPGLAPLVRGHIDGIGIRPRFRATDAAGALLVEQSHAPDDLPELAAAIALAAGWLDAQDGLAIRAIGHRVVHGGPDFHHPVLVDAAVLDRLAGLEALAPLHQPNNLAPIRLFMARAPEVPQVACFDTAFHRGHAPHTDCYALPRALYDEGIRRYGFHGLSYEYIAHRLPEIAPEVAAAAWWSPTSATASRCARSPGGRSIASTMGFTALDGLPMGTRPGQLDPGVVLHLIEERGMTAAEVTRLLYHGAGLKGLSGVSSDMRDLLASDDPGAAFALDHFAHRFGLHAGELAAALGGLDAFVFTAGIGEHAAPIRARIADRLAWLGAELDPAANAAGATRISTPASRVALLVVPTHEELMIARHTLALAPERIATDPQRL